MRVQSDNAPQCIEFDVSPGDGAVMSVDVSQAEPAIEFLISYVNALRRLTGKAELSRTGTGNVRKRAAKKPAVMPAPESTFEPIPVTLAGPSHI